MVESVSRYFPNLSDIQIEQMSMLPEIYGRWNSMINVISRKDMDNFVVHHLLHSLSLGKAIDFTPGTTILDVGTGGGFPGIPLAIMFPEVELTNNFPEPIFTSSEVAVVVESLIQPPVPSEDDVVLELVELPDAPISISVPSLFL